MKKSHELAPDIEPLNDAPLLDDEEEAAALAEIDFNDEDEEREEDSFLRGPFASPFKKRVLFVPTVSEYDDIHEPSFGDAITIRHNFVMLIHLMAEEAEKPLSEQRFTDLKEDLNTHLNNKRMDFQLKGPDNHWIPAYCYRHQKTIVYGISDEMMREASSRQIALPALVQLAKTDIQALTEIIHKPQPPFEVTTSLKEPSLIQEIQAFLMQK